MTFVKLFFSIVTYCRGNLLTSLSMIMIYLVTLSLGGDDAYAQLSDAIALQRVVNQGGKVLFLPRNAELCFFVAVYVTVSMGNSGGGGLQTGSDPADAAGVIAVGSVDSIDASQNFGISPVGNKILSRFELLLVTGSYFILPSLCLIIFQ